MIGQGGTPSFAALHGSVPGVAPADDAVVATFDAAATYHDLAPAVLGYLRAQGAPDADDLLGEVFVQVVRDQASFRGTGDDLRRWVFTIAHHRVIDDARRRRRRPVTEPLEPDTPAGTGTGTAAADGLDPELLAALRRLTDDQRQVVVLRFVADLPLRDVARITGRRLGSTKALQHRGLARLSEILGA